MTDFKTLLVADHGQPARSIMLLQTAGFETWLAGQSAAARTLVHANRFTAKAGESLILPGKEIEDWSIIAGVADVTKLTPWCLASLAEKLPQGTYKVANGSIGSAAFGWLLAHDVFTRYKNVADHGARVLLTTEVAAMGEAIALATATSLVRALVNNAPDDMGPAALEAEAATLAERFTATLTVTKGDGLAQGYPLIYAVGKAASAVHAPRMIELTWGNPAHPKVAIIGKGVTFDSGGLNLKLGNNMRLMKKDMGGAAHALALAQLIMGAGLKLHLHMLIPAAENAIGGAAFRPGDILKSRAGITVEIDNTDAEGRLLLADALTKACENGADTVIDFATLTGAARIALGPELPALFSNDDALTADLIAAGVVAADALWPLPLWNGYRDMLKSDVADTLNSSEGGMAGAITAALFLEKFVSASVKWAHIDTYAWQNVTKPGRPKGGEALGLRAVFAALKARY